MALQNIAVTETPQKAHITLRQENRTAPGRHSGRRERALGKVQQEKVSLRIRLEINGGIGAGVRSRTISER
jgi:hypothetical protein